MMDKEGRMCDKNIGQIGNYSQIIMISKILHFSVPFEN
jgi:hypothetical protein